MVFTDQITNSLGGIFGGGQRSQSGLYGCGIADAYITTGTLTHHLSTSNASGTITIPRYEPDRKDTNMDWLDRRVSEIQVKL